MPQPQAIIDYDKCKPRKCGNGTCIAVTECLNKVLYQEAPWEYVFSHPSHYCRGSARCVKYCQLGALKVI